MSRLLHGPVQGNLAALTLALRIHAAAEHEVFSAGQREVIVRSTALIDESLRTLRDILDEPVGDRIDVGARLVELTRAWRGLMTITLDMSAEVRDASRADPGLLLDALDVVEEGITNASRHGDARNLEIKIRRLITGEVEVVLLNDGRPVSGAVSAGFGLKAIDAAGGRWSLVEVQGGGTCFTVVFPARSTTGG
jgi:signal transduction histidine kinase